MISKQIKLLRDYDDEADAQQDSFGRTNLHSTSFKELDEYLFGGYGRQGNYEIVLVYGDSGIGKSYFVQNILSGAIVKKAKVGLFYLEDDPIDVNLRFKKILQGRDYLSGDNLIVLGEKHLEKGYTLVQLLAIIEEYFTKLSVDIIVLDHLQFAFEGADSLKGDTEYAEQRTFMRGLNALMKRVKKTIILISHTNKTSERGSGKILGSSAIFQTATKVLSVSVNADEQRINEVKLEKSRFTPSRRGEDPIKFITTQPRWVVWNR